MSARPMFFWDVQTDGMPVKKREIISCPFYDTGMGGKQKYLWNRSAFGRYQLSLCRMRVNRNGRGQLRVPC